MKKCLFLLLFTGLIACNGKEDKDKADKENRSELSAESSKVTEVTVMELLPDDFEHEVVCNGRVAGRNRADLYFPSADAVISSVAARNGAGVRKGDALASLDTYKLEEELRQAKTQLAKAELELKDALIGQGYDPENTARIPDDVMKLARLRSGYTEADDRVSSVSRQIAESTIRAPFDGTVANVSAKAFNRPDPSKPVCTVVGGDMDVEFKILEGELAVVKPGDKVVVTPFSTAGAFNGRVAQINPVVDDDGLVTVTASVDGAAGLYDGMNVRVSVRKSLGQQLVVPKSAVVLRSGKQVVFTLSDDGGKALWNYVHTGLENMGNYSITDGLEPGAKVIISNNINLAHEAPVKVLK
jgi:RND family efflux transporter MFP subunit